MLITIQSKTPSNLTDSRVSYIYVQQIYLPLNLTYIDNVLKMYVYKTTQQLKKFNYTNKAKAKSNECAAFVLYPIVTRMWTCMKKKHVSPFFSARERLCVARCDQHKYGSLKKSQLVSYRILYSKHEHLY